MEIPSLILSATLIDSLRRVTRGLPFWEDYLTKLSPHGPTPYAVHVAVVSDPYLDYILDGTKTVESRFSKNRIAPYHSVKEGDVVLLKRTSKRTLSAICLVSNVWFYEIGSEGWSHVRRAFSANLRIEHQSFWEKKEESRFATLMRISNVQALSTIEISKRDRRGWVVMKNEKRPLLAEEEA